MLPRQHRRLACNATSPAMSTQAFKSMVLSSDVLVTFRGAALLRPALCATRQAPYANLVYRYIYIYIYIDFLPVD